MHIWTSCQLHHHSSSSFEPGRCILDSHLQIGILFVRKRHLCRNRHLLLVLFENGLVDLDFRRRKGRSSNEFQGLVADELPGEPQEWLLEVVVRLGLDIVVLEILLSVEGNSFRLDLAFLHIDLVAAEHDRNVLADADKITMPVRHVLVCDARRHIEHDDAALAINVVAITETTELLLSSSVPHVELDSAQVGGEPERVDLNTQSRDVFLLELSSDVTLHKGGLASTTVTDKHELEGRRGLRGSAGFSHGCGWLRGGCRRVFATETLYQRVVVELA